MSVKGDYIMFTRQNSANLRKMILLAAITVATSALTGCQTYPYSKVENEVYGYVNKFSRKIPKGFVRDEEDDGVAYRDPKLVLGAGETEFGGCGRLFIAMSRNDARGIASGYADLEEMRPWLEGGAEEMSKLKPGSLIYFGFVNVQSDPLFSQAVTLIKDEQAVAYMKQANEWQRLEMQFAAGNWSKGPFAWFFHLDGKTGEQVPTEQAQRYINLANTFSKTYLNKEIE
jgi:hypothetical protein